MKTIFITISRGSLIRNFFHTGIISSLLKNNLRVVVLSPNYKDKDLFKDFFHENLFFKPLLAPDKIKLKAVVKEICKGLVFSKTVHARYKYRFAGDKPNKFFYLPRMIFFAPLRFFPFLKKIIRFIDFKINPQDKHDYLFEKYNPDLVFSTDPQGDLDQAVLKSAKRFNIKTVAMPKSWDNLSRALFLVKVDKMLVWGKFNQKQAIKYQGYKDEDVIITGAPQFDYYMKKDRLISREEFCHKFGFDPNKKIILYSSTGGHAFNEADYIDLIKKFIDEKKLENVQVLIRPHLGYIGDKDKFDRFKNIENFAIDNTDKQNKNIKDHWDISLNHLDNLYNSIYHADLNINIASTMTLDSLACGTEVINIGFDADKDIDPNFSITRFYTTDYISEVMSFGGTYLVKNEEEYLEALKNILEKKEDRSEIQKKMIEYFIYKNDGRSAERIVDALIKMV